ncbi:hypothetical protein HY406_00005 [Candidatus Giovannonibacteria bacterium]|nr:hypothetical protein [Candidatus Giovannonibacteria bacterium]
MRNPSFDQAYQMLNLAREAGTSAVFRTLMGGPETTGEIVAYLRENGFNYVKDYITQENFPLQSRETPEEDKIVIHDPGRSFSEEKGLAILKEAGLLRPTYEHAIRFARQHGKATTSVKKPFVIFLHEPWQDPNGNPRVLYQDRTPSDRKLSLLDPGHGFSGYFCVLAGVRPRKRRSVS